MVERMEKIDIETARVLASGASKIKPVIEAADRHVPVRGDSSFYQGFLTALVFVMKLPIDEGVQLMIAGAASVSARKFIDQIELEKSIDELQKE